MAYVRDHMVRVLTYAFEKDDTLKLTPLGAKLLAVAYIDWLLVEWAHGETTRTSTEFAQQVKAIVDTHKRVETVELPPLPKVALHELRGIEQHLVIVDEVEISNERQ